MNEIKKGQVYKNIEVFKGFTFQIIGRISMHNYLVKSTKLQKIPQKGLVYSKNERFKLSKRAIINCCELVNKSSTIKKL